MNKKNNQIIIKNEANFMEFWKLKRYVNFTRKVTINPVKD